MTHLSPRQPRRTRPENYEQPIVTPPTPYERLLYNLERQEKTFTQMEQVLTRLNRLCKTFVICAWICAVVAVGLAGLAGYLILTGGLKK